MKNNTAKLWVSARPADRAKVRYLLSILAGKKSNDQGAQFGRKGLNLPGNRHRLAR